MSYDLVERGEGVSPFRRIILPPELRRGTKIRLYEVVGPDVAHSFLASVGYQIKDDHGWQPVAGYLRLDVGKLHGPDGSRRPGLFLDYPEGVSRSIQRRIYGLTEAVTMETNRLYPRTF